MKYALQAARQFTQTARKKISRRILHLRMRGAGKTICPSEAAQIVAGNRSTGDWRALMPAARKAARRLMARRLSSN